MVAGTPGRPRLAVYRSNCHIYAQVIDDRSGHTLVAASSVESAVRAGGTKGSGREGARAVGTLVAERARAAGIVAVVFDRGGYLYHGRVAAVADGARAGGLEF